jgi:acyl carrier protein
MQRSDLKREIKQLLVSELNLTGRDPNSIEDDAPLFGTGGLGLDSLDALQIAMLVEEKFGIRVPEGDEARPIFQSVSSLSEFIAGSPARDAKAGGTPGTPDPA